MKSLASLAFLFLVSSVASSQVTWDAKIDATHVGEILGFLASDEMAGRDSPSPALERAADFIAERFKKAGLEPGGDDGSYFHRYELPGRTVDGSKIEFRVLGNAAKKLEPGVDFRLFNNCDGYSTTDEEIARFDVSQLGEKGVFPGRRIRVPLVIEVGDDSDLWKSAALKRSWLSSRRRRGGDAPVFLVKKGMLGKGTIRAAITVPEATAGPIPLRNVVGLLPGSEKPDECVLYSAHYDHVGVRLTPGGDAIFNGADDNATGTTAIISLAEAYGIAGPQKRSMAFVAFSAEEKGLRGSAAFADRPSIPLEQIIVNINLEMIGRPEAGKRNYAWVTGRGFSDFEEIVKPAMKKAGIDITVFEMSDQLFRASDNFSLVRKGVVAHSISAGSLHDDYHQPGDEVSKINLPHMTAVIRGLFHAGQAFSEREAKPAYNAAGKKMLERMRR